MIKKVLYILGFFVIGLMLAAVGCDFGVDGHELEIRLAPIREVRLNIAESYPPQIFVYIKGGLADSCTRFHERSTERIGNTINITVTTQRPKGAQYAQVYGYFEENVPLGSDFVSGETYTINVNDEIISFVMQ